MPEPPRCTGVSLTISMKAQQTTSYMENIRVIQVEMSGNDAEKMSPQRAPLLKAKKHGTLTTPSDSTKSSSDGTLKMPMLTRSAAAAASKAICGGANDGRLGDATVHSITTSQRT